jgi:ketosteroid isomerase-like protein
VVVRHSIGVVFGALTLVMCAAGTARGQDCRAPVTQKEALAAEGVRYAAQMKNDFAAMEKLFGDDLVYSHSSAAVDNKKTYIESMRSGRVRYVDMKRGDTVVRTYGCVAVLTGRADFKTTSEGQDTSAQLRFTTIWVKRGDGLQFVSWQSTRVPAAP